MGKFNLNQILNEASKRAAPGGGGQTAPASRPAEIERLSVFDLVPSEDNFYSMNDIEELKSKIELAGKVLQNFIVVPLGGGKYKVLSGHRRRLAVLALVEEGKPEFEFVPCTIEADEQDAEVRAIREEIMLIAANSQREKTAWDKIEETRRTRALLEKIRKQEKLPGDMRKLVAQTLNTSPAQIGRFDAIIRNLCPAFTEELKADRINISTAYELSGLSAEEQAAAFEEYRETGKVSIRDARERKQDPPPAAEEATAPVPSSQPPKTTLFPSEREAREEGESRIPPVFTATPPAQAAQDDAEAAGREEIPPAVETPTEGRTGPQERQETAGHEEPPATSPPSPTGEEKAAEEKAEPETREDIIRRLDDLCSYCMSMGELEEGSRDWTADVNALLFAINTLEGAPTDERG